jgi:hypothetical protein
MSCKFLAFILIVLCCSSLLAGTTDPNISDNKYIEYAADFNYVGKLCGTYKDKTKFCGSCVAIDDHHVLTAAHVVDNSSSCNAYINGKEFCLSTMTIHENFTTPSLGGPDIALGYSKESFDLDFYPELYTDKDETDRLCSISGYGFHGTFITGAKLYDDKKRAGSNVIDRIEDMMLICSPSKKGDKRKTSLEFFIASGDSGGGLFINNKLAGINSCIMAVDRAPSGRYNEESGHTRVSLFIPWINKYKTK